MSTDLLDAAAAVVETLQAENAALAVLDIGAAVKLYPRKRDAVTALATAQASTKPTAEQRQRAELLTRRLAELTGENKRLLERALYVQGRIMGALARAVPRALAATAGYCADGRMAGPQRALALALSAHI